MIAKAWAASGNATAPPATSFSRTSPGWGGLLDDASSCCAELLTALRNRDKRRHLGHSLRPPSDRRCDLSCGVLKMSRPAGNRCRRICSLSFQPNNPVKPCTKPEEETQFCRMSLYLQIILRLTAPSRCRRAATLQGGPPPPPWAEVHPPRYRGRPPETGGGIGARSPAQAPTFPFRASRKAPAHARVARFGRGAFQVPASFHRIAP